jgi:hypothetical protein
MKKLILFIFTFLIIINTNAQYKKAKFFSKEGRTFALGLTSRFFGKGFGSAQGINLSHGKEKEGKKIFHWWDLEYVRGNNYTSIYSINEFNGTTYVPTTYAVPSSSGSTLAYRYNLAYFLSKDEEKKVSPFVHLSLSYLIGLSGRFNDDAEEQGNFFASVGAGGIYKIKERIGLKFSGSYNLSPLNFGSSNNSRPEVIEIPNHIALSLGIRWLMDKDDD